MTIHLPAHPVTIHLPAHPVTIHLPAHPVLLTTVLRAAEICLPGCGIDLDMTDWVVRITEPPPVEIDAAEEQS